MEGEKYMLWRWCKTTWRLLFHMSGVGWEKMWGVGEKVEVRKLNDLTGVVLMIESFVTN